MTRPMLAFMTLFVWLVAGQGAVAAQTAPKVWVPAWTASPAPARFDGAPDAPKSFNNETVRQDIRLGTSADRIRIRVSNEVGDTPIRLGPMSASLTEGDAAPLPVRFNGRTELILMPGMTLLSDPIDVSVAAFAEVSVSVYFPEPTRGVVRRTILRASPGQGAVSDTVNLTRRQSVISAILAERTQAPRVLVAFGDSITEQNGSNLAVDNGWAARLGRRMEATCPGQFVVLNAGISGNQIVIFGRSPSAQMRLDRDVLSMPGVTDLILLEGINDIRHAGDPAQTPGRTADEVIAGYGQIVDRLHAHGIRVFGGTLPPFGRSERFEPIAETSRQNINAFIRNAGAFDGVIDFETATRDPAHPDTLLETAQGGDFLHPNDEGYRLMAEAIDLTALGCTPS